jgi:hypothetical protein
MWMGRIFSQKRDSSVSVILARIRFTLNPGCSVHI